MSLINDALKRASESDRNRPPQAALPRLMQPVAAIPRQPPAKRRPRQVFWLVAAIALEVFGLVLAGWYCWKWWDAAHPIVATAPAAPRQLTAAAPPPAPNPASVVPGNPPPSATAAAAPAPPVSDPDGWPVNLSVRAIFYDKTSPRALVNGRMVGPGDKVDGVLVTGIQIDRVLVEWNGKSKEITMRGGP
jgi:hypothetical protein